MSRQPRRNEQRFYRYPMRRVVAILNESSHVDAALHDLERTGVDVADVNILSGQDGARLLDRSGTGHGLLARLLRFLQRSASEMDTLRAHEGALNDGHHVMYVPVRGESERSEVIGVLHAAGGHDLLYYGRWSVEQIPGRTPRNRPPEY